jgi:hypothetical protein
MSPLFYIICKRKTFTIFLSGDAKRNAQRIASDFYLTSFDPRESLNLENIFYDFPRLSAILASDCIPLQVRLINGK